MVPDNPMPVGSLVFATKLPIDCDKCGLAKASTIHAAFKAAYVKADVPKLAVELHTLAKGYGVALGETSEFTAGSPKTATIPGSRDEFHRFRALLNLVVRLAGKHRDAGETTGCWTLLLDALHRASVSGILCPIGCADGTPSGRKRRLRHRLMLVLPLPR